MSAAHSDLGASSAERWMNCTGSVNLSKGLPGNTSEYAIEGTAAHTLGERALRKNLDADVWLGSEIPVQWWDNEGNEHTKHVEVTEEMCEAVQVYLDHVRKYTLFEDRRMVEVRFDLAPLDPPEPMFGTSDCVNWTTESKHLQVFDYKHGAGVAVDAHENAQMMYYALGAVIALKVKPDVITVTIIQPRASHPAGTIRDYTFGWDELVAFKRELFAKAVATQATDAPLVTGPWCRFCRAQAICPAQRANAIEVAQSEFDVDPAFLPPAPETLTVDQIGLVLAKAPLVEEWFKAIRNYVTGKLDAGQKVPGWKLVPKRASRRWADEDAAKLALMEDGGLEKDDCYAPRKLVSPAQAEAKLKELKVRYDLTHLVIKESSGTNLVSDSDTRAALAPSAQTDFSVMSDAEKPALALLPEPKRTRTRARRGAKTQ